MSVEQNISYYSTGLNLHNHNTRNKDNLLILDYIERMITIFILDGITRYFSMHAPESLTNSKNIYKCHLLKIPFYSIDDLVFNRGRYVQNYISHNL